MRYVNALRCKQAGTSKLVACPADSQDTGKDSAWHITIEAFSAPTNKMVTSWVRHLLNWGFLHCAMIVHTAFFCRISSYSAPRNNEMPASKGNFPPKAEDSDWGKKNIDTLPHHAAADGQIKPSTWWRLLLSKAPWPGHRLCKHVSPPKSLQKDPGGDSAAGIGMVFQDLRGGSISQISGKKLW